VFSVVKGFAAGPEESKAFNTENTEGTEKGNPAAPCCPSPILFARIGCGLCYLRGALEERLSMAEKLVLVGVIPEIVVINADEQVVWLSESGNLKVQFDPNRCPFQSNVFQAPAGRQLQSGPPRPGVNPGAYRYRLWLNDQPVGNGEVILREK
jgi:hypothetical protein